MILPSVRPSTAAKLAVAAGLIITIITGVVFGLELALLVLGGSVLTLIIGLFWSSVRNLSGDTPLTLDEAIAFGAQNVAEEQKRAVLRALKDLEFERSVGKISEQDYSEFSARYRAEARRLIEKADESNAPAHDLAQKLATERLAAAGLVPGSKSAKPADPEPTELETAEDDASAEEDSSIEATNGIADTAETDGDDASDVAEARDAAVPELRTCAECHTKNDLDARFCKSCGAELGRKAKRADVPVIEEEKTS